MVLDLLGIAAGVAIWGAGAGATFALLPKPHDDGTYVAASFLWPALLPAILVASAVRRSSERRAAERARAERIEKEMWS
jgi:hypothetical protein